jgi:hypothetical protein
VSTYWAKLIGLRQQLIKSLPEKGTSKATRSEIKAFIIKEKVKSSKTLLCTFASSFLFALIN